MAATRDKYQPTQISERWFTPYTTCSLISWSVGEYAATLGESIIWPSGVPYGVKALKNRIKKGWTAADHDRNDAGYGTVDFNNFMKGIGSPIRLSDVKFIRNAEDIKEALKKNAVITIAGNTKHCRSASPIRKWVGEANHRIAVKGFRVKDGQNQTRLYEPMTPYTDKAHWGKWIPLWDVFQFGKQFKHWGLYLAERFVTGHFTREAKARRAGAKTALQLQSRIVDLTEENIEANRTIERKQARIDALKVELEHQPDRQAILIAAENIRALAAEVTTEADTITDATSVSPLREPTE